MTTTFDNDLEQKLTSDPDFARRFGAAQAKSSFALTLAEVRRRLNLTQQQLADRVQVSQAYVAKLESGDANPTLDRIGSLLAVLGFSLTTGTADLLSSRSTESPASTPLKTNHKRVLTRMNPV